MTLGKPTTATVRRKLVSIPARIASSARKLTRHLPTAWALETAWRTLFDAGCGPRDQPPTDDPADAGATQNISGTRGQKGPPISPAPSTHTTSRVETSSYPPPIGGSRLSGCPDGLEPSSRRIAEAAKGCSLECEVRVIGRGVAEWQHITCPEPADSGGTVDPEVCAGEPPHESVPGERPVLVGPSVTMNESAQDLVVSGKRKLTDLVMKAFTARSSRTLRSPSPLREAASIVSALRMRPSTPSLSLSHARMNFA